jgi:hypothetical protein
VTRSEFGGLAAPVLDRPPSFVMDFFEVKDEPPRA